MDAFFDHFSRQKATIEVRMPWSLDPLFFLPYCEKGPLFMRA